MLYLLIDNLAYLRTIRVEAMIGKIWVSKLESGGKL
jgi:hypothetical protein